MGFLELAVLAEIGVGEERTNCFSEVISAPDKRAGCLGLEVWLRRIPGNTTTCNYFTPDLPIRVYH